MSNLRVGVLRGGPSSEHGVSVQTGAQILRALSESEHRARDIFIDKGGQWHVQGAPRDSHEIRHYVDVVINGLHGHYGEDGKVQQFLERLNMPYTGSGIVSSALAMHKGLSKLNFEKHELKSPSFAIVREDEDISVAPRNAFQKVPSPWIVKPASSGSSFGVTLVQDYRDLHKAIVVALEHSPAVIVEEFIKGREATVGVIEGFRGEELYTLPPTEIIPADGHTFFDAETNYNGKARKICPGQFSREEKLALQDVARRAHRALGLRHYSRSDFIVSSRGIYLLEVNSLPGLTEESLFPPALEAVGSSLLEFIEHLVALAQNKN